MRSTRGVRRTLVTLLLRQPGVQYSHLSASARRHLACLDWNGGAATARAAGEQPREGPDVQLGSPVAAVTAVGEADTATDGATDTATATAMLRAEVVTGRHGQAEVPARAGVEGCLAAPATAAAGIEAVLMGVEASERADVPAAAGSMLMVRVQWSNTVRRAVQDLVQLCVFGLGAVCGIMLPLLFAARCRHPVEMRGTMPSSA